MRPALEIADIFRRHGPAWRAARAGHVSLDQLRVMSAIETCRTAALGDRAREGGGHAEGCEKQPLLDYQVTRTPALAAWLVELARRSAP